jgi:hypothetical protein
MKTNAWILFFALATATNFLTPFAANGALIAYWHFNTYNGTSTTLSADAGSGSMSFGAFSGDTATFTGTSINAVSGTVAGSDLALRDLAHNGQALTIHVSGTGLADFVVTYATQRSSLGFTAQDWAYSTDNISFTPFTTISPPSSYALRTVDFSAISSIENQTDVYFRMTLTGATDSGGNNRFDNFQITAVPEPTTIALGIFAAGLLAFSGARALRKKAKIGEATDR